MVTLTQLNTYRNYLLNVEALAVLKSSLKALKENIIATPDSYSDYYNEEDLENVELIKTVNVEDFTSIEVETGSEYNDEGGNDVTLENMTITYGADHLYLNWHFGETVLDGMSGYADFLYDNELSLNPVEPFELVIKEKA